MFTARMLESLNSWIGKQPGMFGALIEEEERALAEQRAALKAVSRGAVEVRDDRSSESGGARLPSMCRLKMRLLVEIDDRNLDYSVRYFDKAGSSCSTSNWHGAEIDKETAAMRNKIGNIVSAIKDHQNKLDNLRRHVTAVAALIDDVQKAAADGT